MPFTLSDAEARLIVLETIHCQSPELASLRYKLQVYLRTQSPEHQSQTSHCFFSTWPEDSEALDSFNGYFDVTGSILRPTIASQGFPVNEETFTVDPGMILGGDNISPTLLGSLDAQQSPSSDCGAYSEFKDYGPSSTSHLPVHLREVKNARASSHSLGGHRKRKIRRRRDAVGRGRGKDESRDRDRRGGVHPGLRGGSLDGGNGNDEEEDDEYNDSDDSYGSLSQLNPDWRYLAGKSEVGEGEGGEEGEDEEGEEDEDEEDEDEEDKEDKEDKEDEEDKDEEDKDEEGEERHDGKEQQKRDDIPEIEKQLLGTKTVALLMCLVKAAKNILNDKRESKNVENAVSVLETVSNDDSVWRIQASSHDSLTDVVNRCIKATKATAYMQFILSLHLMHYRTKIECVHLLTGIKREDIVDNLHVGLKKQTLGQWRKLGSSYCILAGAGSLYLLAILASAKIKTTLREIATSEILRLAAAIRAPNPETECGKMIIASLIPAIAKLQKRYNFKFCTLFARRYFRLVQPEFIMAADIRTSDKFFDSIALNQIVKPRNWALWVACDGNLSPYAPTRVFLPWESSSAQPLPVYDLEYCPSFESSHLSSPTAVNSSLCFSQSSFSDINIIDTGYDPNLKQNKKSKLQRRAPSQEALDLSEKQRSLVEEAFKFTEEQRSLAEEAYVPKDFNDLKTRLQEQLQTGERKGGYIKITHDILDGKILRINDVNGNIICVIDPTMPHSMRTTLVDRLSLIFPKTFLNTDTKSMGVSHKFLSYHHCNYNRYSVQGIGSDPSREPATYSRNGRTYNTATMIPRTSAEQNLLPELHTLLVDSFSDLFEWKSNQLKNLLPGTYNRLARFANCLPGDEFPAAYPYGGFVVNLNVATKIHRDSKDQDICTVFCISECVGGDLGLLETGILLALQSGDSVDFKSTEQTHFNCHFVGKRASIVLHTDSTSTAWTDGTPTVPRRNGWVSNKYFRSSSPVLQESSSSPAPLPPSRKRRRTSSSDSDMDF